MRKRGGARPSRSEARAVPRLALTHALWLLSELGFRGGVSASTRSIRKIDNFLTGRAWIGYCFSESMRA
jgi:hypothetical protein